MNLDTRFLNGIRGLAALYVLIGHARWLLWEGYSSGYATHPGTYTLFQKIQMYFFSAFKYGHEVVLLFFVLSGFVIHLSSEKLVLSKNLFSYFKKRFIRIYPPFLLSLVLVFVLDSIGKYIYPGVYTGLTTNAEINKISSFFTAPTLIGNMLFLMPNHVNFWGTNGPVWSLKYEFWFYILYPALVYLTPLKSKALAVFVVLSMLYIVGLRLGISTQTENKGRFILLDIICNMATWWIGVLLADAYRYGHRHLIIILNFCIILLPAGFLLKSDYVLAIGFAGLISIFLSFPNYVRMPKRALERIGFLGDFSYSVYILHFPFLVLLSAVVFRFNGKLPVSHLYVFLGAICAVGYCWVFYNLVEKRVNNVKAK